MENDVDLQEYLQAKKTLPLTNMYLQKEMSPL